MIIQVTNKFISWGRDSSYVKDENGNELYTIKGKFKWFSPSRKKWIYNKEGKKVYTVRNKMLRAPFTLSAALIYDGNGEKLGRLQKKWSRANRYVLIGEHYDSIRIGFDRDHKGITVFKNDVVIASFYDNSLLRDSFKVDVISEEDLDLIVSLVIAVDNLQDKARDK